MGPWQLPTKLVNNIGWAHFSCLKNLPIALNGPMSAAYKHCQQHWMGPFQLPTKLADSIEWADGSCLQILPIGLDGPIAAAYKHC